MHRTDPLRPRLLHVSHLILDRAESMLAPGRDDPVAQRIARAKCSLMALWRWCGLSRCRRRRNCCGEAHQCLRLRSPRVPPEIAAVVETLFAEVRRNAGRRPRSLRARQCIDRIVQWRAEDVGM